MAAGIELERAGQAPRRVGSDFGTFPSALGARSAIDSDQRQRDRYSPNYGWVGYPSVELAFWGLYMGRHGLLGSAVLVYAVLTSGALLSVAWGWQEAVNGALWLAYFLGGFGLIRGKGWGRTLTLLAAGGSLLVMFVLPITAEAKLNHYSPVWILGGLPALAILVSALLVKLPPSQEVEVPPPTGAARKPRISQRTRHDIAYISFIVLGLIAIWTSYWAHVDPDPGVIGFLVLIPFGIPLLLALILGPGLSMVLWRDLRLMTLTVLSIAMLVALNSLGLKAFPIPLFLYAAACITMGLIWFTKYRRHCG